MSEQAPDIEEADLLLAQAAKLDFALMRHAQSLALSTDDADEVATLTHAYSRASRCMRQNLALLAKQKADRIKAAREADQHKAWMASRSWAPERDLEELAREERTGDLQYAVGRVISAASAGDKKLHADWIHRFDRELDDWSEEDDFLDEEDIDVHVQTACRRLGLPDHLATQWRDLPDPDVTPDPEPRTAEGAPAHELQNIDDPVVADLAVRAAPWANSS